MERCLTVDSIKIIKFIDNLNVKTNITNSFNSLFSLLLKNYKFKIDYKFKTQNYKYNKLEDRNLYSKYCSSAEVQSSVKFLNKKTYIHSDNIDIYVYHTGCIDKDLIYKRVAFLNHLYPGDKIQMKLWLTTPKKTFSKHKKMLGTENVNSGLTSFYPNREITIFRKEEHKKLILHELIHFLDLDFEDKIYLNFSDHFNISPELEIILFESYTEITACIINAILTSYECNNRQNFSLFKKLIEIETKFALFQSAKILLFFGFKDTADFAKPYDGQNRFRETSHIFSYYIIKSALLYNTDKMAEFYNEYCDGIKFRRESKSYDAYKTLILISCLDTKLLKEVDKLMLVINNSKKLQRFNSLKMTCIEI
jgi:hypothetical protein